MATMFRTQSIENLSQNSSVFDAITELKKHAWYPQMTVIEAEAALSNKPPYTYITRPRGPGEGARGYAISFVNLNGSIEHHYFTLIDSNRGVWRNFHPDHVGSLGKVICDMMDCEVLNCKPL